MSETDESDLIVGAFYWAMPVNDPDLVEKWEYYCQPVRFWGRSETGEPLWQSIVSGDEPNDYGMRWIGPRIISPMGDEDERIALGNSKSEWST